MYTPLKVTTDYTLLSSLIKIDDLIKYLIKHSIKCCAICDVNLFGSIEFYKKCIDNNIKPIIGLEIKLDNKSIYLYAKNYEGYKNLLKINSLIIENIIEIDILKKYKDNILIIVPIDNYDLFNILDFYKERFIGYKNIEEKKNALVITDNIVYINDIRCFTKNSKKYLEYLDKFKEENNEYQDCYFDYDDLDNDDLNYLNNLTNLINITFPKNMRYIPKYNNEIDSFSYLKNLSLKGLKKRLNRDIPSKYLDRLKYELSIINKMGFTDYFLIVYDYVLYAKKNNILVGPGRGSAAGSLVSYSIGITDIDPIKYDLLFERFLNYERVTMPDIDIDFENTKREEVINYVREKYGKYNVSGGITFATLKTRLVLRDVAKILKIDERLLYKFIKVLDRNLSLKDNLENNNVKEYLNNYNELKKLYDISMHLEGLKKNISTHAAGIVIADRPLDEIIPMYKNNDIYITGVEMNYLEDLGLLKMDFLALKNLSTIANIIKKIGNIDLNKIPLEDKKTYELLSSGNTDGIFQFETYAFKKILPKFNPQSFQELIALIALNRPGPSQELETYIKRKNKQQIVSYYDDTLKDILKDTYGVIVYQEQVIQILVKMANFSYALADNIRRAMSKKKEDIINKYRETFIVNAINNGYKKELAINIYEHILKFASYGFNKAHSVSYSIISYWMAYLKAHYKALFTFELLNNSMGDREVIKNYLNELKKDSINIYHVNINKSLKEFKLDNNSLYLPFNIIKNIKSDVINSLLEEREKNGLYKDVFDFFKRTNSFITKTTYTMLINAGVLNDFNINTHKLIVNLDALINYGNLSKDLEEYALIPQLEDIDEYDNETLMVNEINSYGFYISNHPASKEEKNIVKAVNMHNYLFKNVITYVLVNNIKSIKTKNNEDMAFLDGEDETGSINYTVFPKSFYLLKNIKKGDIIKVWGTVNKRYDKISIAVTNIIKE